MKTIKQTKFLKIISNPKGALIYINGVSTSLKTPENIDIDQFKRKTISITLIKDGYYQYTTKATILGEYDQELYAELLRQQL